VPIFRIGGKPLYWLSDKPYFRRKKEKGVKKEDENTKEDNSVVGCSFGGHIIRFRRCRCNRCN